MLKILCVDDDIGIHTAFRAIIDHSREFSDWPYEQALSIGEGLLKAKIFKPDVVLLDLHFEGDGVKLEDATEATREFSKESAVIIITGYATPDRWFACARSGAVGFLDKNDVFGVHLECPKCGTGMGGLMDLGARELFKACVNAAILWKAREHGC